MKKQGINFYFHIDAAYGGYSRVLFLDEKSRFMEYEELKERLSADGIFVHEYDYPLKKYIRVV